MQAEDWRWLGGWARRIGTATYFTFLFAFMIGDVRPVGYDSLAHAAFSALLPALSGTALTLAALLYWRRR